RKGRPRWVLAATPVLAVVALIPIPPEPLRPGEARVAILAVSKGLATVVQTADHAIMIDCGAGTVAYPGKRFVAPYLWTRGVRSLDAIFLSHAHADHTNAVLETVDRFTVREVIVSPEFR